VEHADEENGSAFGLNFQFDWIFYFEDVLMRRTIFFFSRNNNQFMVFGEVMLIVKY